MWCTHTVGAIIQTVMYRCVHSDGIQMEKVGLWVHFISIGMHSMPHMPEMKIDACDMNGSAMNTCKEDGTRV